MADVVMQERDAGRSKMAIVVLVRPMGSIDKFMYVAIPEAVLDAHPVLVVALDPATNLIDLPSVKAFQEGTRPSDYRLRPKQQLDADQALRAFDYFLSERFHLHFDRSAGPLDRSQRVLLNDLKRDSNSFSPSSMQICDISRTVYRLAPKKLWLPENHGASGFVHYVPNHHEITRMTDVVMQERDAGSPVFAITVVVHPHGTIDKYVYVSIPVAFLETHLALAAALSVDGLLDMPLARAFRTRNQNAQVSRSNKPVPDPIDQAMYAFESYVSDFAYLRLDPPPFSKEAPGQRKLIRAFKKHSVHAQIGTLEITDISSSAGKPLPRQFGGDHVSKGFVHYVPKYACYKR